MTKKMQDISEAVNKVKATMNAPMNPDDPFFTPEEKREYVETLQAMGQAEKQQGRSMPGNVNCEVCQGQGIFVWDVPSNHELSGKAQTCKCVENDEQAMERLKKEAGLPFMAYALTLDSLSDFGGGRAEANQAVRDFATHCLERPSGSLGVVGDYGSGKTHLGQSMVSELVQAGMAAQYITINTYLEWLKDTFSDGPVSAREIRTKYGDAPVLVMDELDHKSINMTDWAISQIFTLANTRYEQRGHVATVYLMSAQWVEDYCYAGGPMDMIFSRISEGTPWKPDLPAIVYTGVGDLRRPLGA